MQPLNDELKLGTLVLPGDQATALPLEHTKVMGHVTGPAAEVTVEQRFGNPFKEAVELEYLFPLPHEAAIVDYQITIGDRTIHAELKELRAARQTYEDAIDVGQRASLLEQRRPNLYSLRIGNAQPGEHILTMLRYEERLHFSDDSYQFVFPMGVTPKYHADPTEVAKLDSPIAPPSEPIAQVEIMLQVDGGIAVGEPISPSHQFAMTRIDSQRFNVSLNTLPTKDFVLRYALASQQVESAVWMSKGDAVDTALISIIPPRLTIDFDPAPREFIFVLDRSGSMSHAPITQARNALRACLRTLSEKDTFAIQAFDDEIEWFASGVQPVMQSSVENADKLLASIEGRGGTDIVPAIKAALALPVDATRQRYLVFLTDGAVSAEQQAYEQIKYKRANARIFTFGVGPSVNRALLVKMAELGRGKAEFIQLDEDLEATILRFADRVSYPVLQDIQLEWQGVQIWDAYPSRLPDLYIGEPLELITRLKLAASGQVILRGTQDGKQVILPIALATSAATNTSVERLWARARVEAIQDDTDVNVHEKREQIIALALQHRLLTQYTAFVSVDSEVISDKAPQYIRIAQPLPEQVDFGQGIVANAMIIPAARPPMSVSLVNYAVGGIEAKPWDDEKYNTPIESLDLSVRVFDSLKRTGITSVGEVLEMLDRGADAMLAIRNFGEKSLDSLIANLKTKGYLPPDLSLSASNAEPEPSNKLLALTVEESLKWLARTQNIFGSWGQGEIEVEMTAVAILAFVRAGYTTRAGDYRRQLQKSVVWLRQMQVGGFDSFILWRAITELQDAENNVEQYVSQEPDLPATDIERAALGIEVTVPQVISTLDDLRIVALVGSRAIISPDLIIEGDSNLIQTWFAVGKPLQEQ